MKILSEKLICEKRARYHGGIYHKLQIDFAYNSNHIEGSKLSYDQMRYIYETGTIDAKNTPVNDIIETVNHFRCFDYVLDTLSQTLTEEYIKRLHKMLKSSVLADEDFIVIGDYKSEANIVGEIKMAAPDEVANRMKKLLDRHYGKQMSFYDIVSFHAEYEKIHPFYDGNGRTGRLIMLKQCLENNIVPFNIDEHHKMYYYMGLKEWQTEEKKNRLIDVFLSAQDDMKVILDYFHIVYDHTELTCRDVLAMVQD